MTSVSYSLTGQQDARATNVAVGSSAPGAGDLEIRINMANVKTRKEANKLIEEIKKYINDGMLNTSFRP